jgi:O-antigen/teichoic acid export membrane protein
MRKLISLPTRWLEKTLARPSLVKVLKNIAWLFFDKVLRLGVGLFVGVWLARYLGPDQFGLLSYAMALVALAGALSGLGLNGIIVRDLVREPKTGSELLGTAFLLSCLAGVVSVLLLFFGVVWLRPNDKLTVVIVAVLSLTLVFRATDVVKYWFESQLHSRYSVWIENGVFLIMTFVRIVFILSQFPLMAFAWLILTEAVLVSVGLLLVYAWRGGHLRTWQVKYARAKTLLIASWPMMLSSLAVMAYMRIDQIMLGEMLGHEAVGVFSVGVRLSEVWYMIPMVIVSSTFPMLVQLKAKDDKLYRNRLQALFNLMVCLALVVAVPMTFFSEAIVSALFGGAYYGAGAVLAVHIWTSLFAFLGVASGSWYLAEDLQKLAFWRTILGLLMNVGANCYLIPQFGTIGAAVGTLLAQASAAYFFDGLQKRTREIFWMKTKSFYTFYQFGVHLK